MSEVKDDAKYIFRFSRPIDHQYQIYRHLATCTIFGKSLYRTDRFLLHSTPYVIPSTT